MTDQLMRADSLLVEQQLANSRTKAQQWISEGKVFYWVNGQRNLLTKPSLKLALDTQFSLSLDESDRYVSRGAIKLKAAIDELEMNIKGLVALDIGASTGGFTEVLLRGGASRVVCVDVGHNQLAESVKSDPRVINFEGVNARALNLDLLEQTDGKGFDLIVMDVSFISQTLILHQFPKLCHDKSKIISLVKPQFELGPDAIGKGGIVKNVKYYQNLENDMRMAYDNNQMRVDLYMPSPIKGGDGNREFLLSASF